MSSWQSYLPPDLKKYVMEVTTSAAMTLKSQPLNHPTDTSRPSETPQTGLLPQQSAMDGKPAAYHDAPSPALPFGILNPVDGQPVAQPIADGAVSPTMTAEIVNMVANMIAAFEQYMMAKLNNELRLAKAEIMEKMKISLDEANRDITDLKDQINKLQIVNSRANAPRVKTSSKNGKARKA